MTDEIDIWCVVLPMNDEQMIAELIEALNNRDLLVQHHASETLGSMGFLAIEPVISVLAEFATWEDFENFAKKHSFAEEALVKIGKPAVERLIEVLDGDRWGLRFGAIYCLQEIGDTRAILPLVEIMRIADINVGSEVSDALAKFGEPAFEPALNALRNKNKNVQRGAAQTLARMKDARAVSHLLTALKEDDINCAKR